MDIPLSSDALDLSFHPSDDSNLLAVGLISGKIQLVNYDAYLAAPSSSRTPLPPQPPSKKARTSSATASASAADVGEKAEKLYRKIWVSRPSKKSCRGLHFAHDGASIYSISKDKGLFCTDTETGKLVDSWVGVHDAAPSRVLPIDEGMVVTGDDDGVVRLWDPRKGGGVGVKPVRQWDHHFDWITDMVYLSDLPVPKPKTPAEAKKSKVQLKKQRKKARQAALLKQAARDDTSDAEGSTDSDSDDAAHGGESRSRLIVTSGDGSLSSIDLRSSGPTSFELSEDQEDELLSITSVRRSSKLVVGTQLGILSLWTPARGLLDHVDRVPGHPASVDALVTLDDETVLTGSSDGLVRVVQILPSKLLGVIASHNGLPVERMKRKDRVLASIGHSNAVKLTDLSPLLDDNEDEDDEEGGALGIVGLGASDSEDDEEDEEDEDDFAGLQADAADAQDDDDEEDVDEAEDNEDVNNDDEDDDDDDDDDEEVSAPRSKEGSKGGFFSDM